ncbi:MAG: YggT family protein [Bacteroidota bacterium]
MDLVVRTLIQLLDLLFNVWTIMLFIWVILSWIPQISRHHPAVEFLERFVEPVVAPFRRLLPMPGGLDLSPLIAYFVISAIYQVLVQLLRQSMVLY